MEQQNNEQVDYQVLGEGRDLVLVHGWGVNSAIWSIVAEQLSQDYRVHLVDLPGYGEQPDVDHYSLANISNTILQKLPEHAIWCGWSLGGLVATYVAAHFPERVDKLIQVCTSMKFVEQEQWRGVKKEVFDAFKVGVSKQSKKTLTRFFSLQAMGSDTVKSDIMTIKSLLTGQPLPTSTALLSGLDLLNDVDLRNDFEQLSMPCLSLFGEHDSLVPITNLQAVMLLSPSKKKVVFECSSHAPFISESECFIEVLKRFI
ncbi:pimeloyl-ACP methyl ester esterase BioH [Psychromonas sp. RZ22]|nr:pimeloyl-ACP methyl ester esterase BioH [Psychromonas sp. RZ22]